LVRDLIDYHEAYHHEHGINDEEGAYKTEYDYLNKKISALPEGDPGRKVLEDFKERIEKLFIKLFDRSINSCKVP
jgi:hypothetical protein